MKKDNYNGDYMLVSAGAPHILSYRGMSFRGTQRPLTASLVRNLRKSSRWTWSQRGTSSFSNEPSYVNCAAAP